MSSNVVWSYIAEPVLWVGQVKFNPHLNLVEIRGRSRLLEDRKDCYRLLDAVDKHLSGFGRDQGEYQYKG